MKKTLTFLLLLLSVSATNLFAWSLTGHRVIAEVAQQNLTSKAKKNIGDLLDGKPLAYWSNWADYIKSDTLNTWRHTYVWHYVNAPSGLSKSEFVSHIQGVKQESLYSAIPQLIEIVKDKKKTKEDRKFALIFLIHLVGDVHQPMHVGQEVDLGGNKIKLKYFGRDVNLHSLWDSNLVNSEGYGYAEYADILNIASKEQKKVLQQGVLEDWLYESHVIATHLYGMVEEGDDLRYDYQFKTKDIMETQLQRGGFRLAKVLNELF